MFNEITTQVEVTARTKIPIEITSSEAFRILCKTLKMDFILDDEYRYYLKVFDEDLEDYDPYYDQPCVCYVDETGQERVISERGNLFAALCSVAVHTWPNLECRSEPYIYRYEPKERKRDRTDE